MPWIFEPENVAEAVVRLGLEHIVITSVDRDDLADGEHLILPLLLKRLDIYLLLQQLKF